jgi:transposase InsO family protein
MITTITQATGHGVRRVCQVLDVPRSSYYHAAEATQSTLDDAALAKPIGAIFAQHRRRYGYRRIWKELSAQGIVCAPCRVRRLMAQLGLVALQPKSYAPKTSDGRADAPSPNLLLDKPLPTLPNKVWAGDITFIRCGDKWLYLAVVIDLCSRRIVGWSLGENMRSDLVVDALRKALQARRGTQGLIFHSDRGSQYGSKAFRDLLKLSDIQQSMSARANPYHNAWTESFMGTLKAELIQMGSYICYEDAHTDLFDFIDGYYNTQRLHSSLNYLTPSHFESLIALRN